jgi:hypothetical protein
MPLFKVAVASVAVPFMKVTLPVGVPLPLAGVTVSLSVTSVPTTTVVADALSTLVVAVRLPCVTVMVTAADVLPANVEVAA